MFKLWNWYYKRKKNDFEKLCDEIEACKKRKNCECNPIICARIFVKEYVRGDMTRLLRIKSEVNSNSYNEFITSMVSMTAAGATIIGVIVSLYTDAPVIFKLYVLLVLIMLVLMWGVGFKKFKNVGKWQNYVKTIIVELEEQMKTNTNH